MDKIEQLREASRFHPTSVWRQRAIVILESRPWSRSIHALLRHLEAEGFDAAPRVMGTGFNAEGRETLSYIEGETMSKGAWSLDAAYAVGQLLRRLHDATATFAVPTD